MERGRYNVRTLRRWVTLGVVALATTAALVAGGGLVVAPTASAESAPDFPLPPPLPPLPVPFGDMQQRGQDAMGRFDAKKGIVPDSIASWGVDAATGKLVVNVVGARTPATDVFTADTDPAAITVRTDAAPVRPFVGDLVGGQAMVNGRIRCSQGFNMVLNGYRFIATAGHCTADGGTWSANSTVIGPVSASSFPTDDYGAIYVQNTGAWRSTARVQGGPTVRGSTVARVGAQVCRSGSTTGYRCGVIQAYNQTVNYGSGKVVSGLTRTNVCAEPGDSGGSFITPAGQAQGLTSGGSGNCTTGGTTYFQPINEFLQRYRGLRLVTG